LFALGCQRDISDFEQATYSKNPDVFIDTFSSGLNYAAFGGSNALTSELLYAASSTTLTSGACRSSTADAQQKGDIFSGSVRAGRSGRRWREGCS
jgi:hypothetical protein